MVYKYKDVVRLGPKKGVNKPFENVYVRGVLKNIFREGASNFDIF